MPIEDANEFLSSLFLEQTKRGFITLKNGKIVIYNILEKNMLDKIQENDMVSKIKNNMFNVGLISSLQNKYNTEIFIEGK